MPAQILPMLDDAHQQLAAQDQQQQMQYHQSLMALQQGKQQLNAQTEQMLNPLRQQAMQAQIQSDQAKTAQTLYMIQSAKDEAPQRAAESKARVAESNARIDSANRSGTIDPSEIAKNQANTDYLRAETAKTQASTPGMLDQVGKFLDGLAGSYKTFTAGVLQSSESNQHAVEAGNAKAAGLVALADVSDPQLRELIINQKVQDGTIRKQDAQAFLNLPIKDYTPLVSQEVGPVAGARYADLNQQIKDYKAPAGRDAATMGSESDSLKQLFAEKSAILQKTLDIRDMKKADFSHAQDMPIGKDGTPDLSKTQNFGLYKLNNVPYYIIGGKAYDGRSTKTQAMLKDYGGN